MPRHRRLAQEERTRIGRRLRELRLATGMTQAELAGTRFSHAYVSVLEAGRREPSRAAMDYFAQRLGVAVEELWGEQGASWTLQMAEDLRAQGDHVESRKLLEKTLANLERDRELHPRVLVRFHRELGRIHLARGDTGSAQAHFENGLELAGEDESLLAERAEMNAELGELLLRTGKRDQAIQRFRTCAAMFLDLLGRSPARLSGSRGRS